MGTNYYLYEKKPCPTCGHQDEPLHIGKSSAGWCFSLHVDEDKGINSLQDWITRWSAPDVTILDEYGDVISSTEMLNIITERKREPLWDKAPFGYPNWQKFHADNESEEGPDGMLRHRIGRFCLAHGEGSYDLMTGSFS